MYIQITLGTFDFNLLLNLIKNYIAYGLLYAGLQLTHTNVEKDKM